MYKKIVFIFLTCFLFSCSDSDIIKIPDHILPAEKMAEVFEDLHLLEAIMNIHVGTPDKIKPGSAVINIYNKHQITKEQFEESYKFYTENPELLAEIYQLVLNNLSKLQAEVMSGK
jgi:hypothetical protein